jgi:hypothetical protein
VSIRPANIDNASLLAELGARTFEETFGADNTREDIAAYLASAFNPEQPRAELAHPASTFLIAEVEGIAAGYGKLHASEQDSLYALETKNGIESTAYNPEFAKQVETAERVMHEDRDAPRKLAK